MKYFDFPALPVVNDAEIIFDRNSLSTLASRRVDGFAGSASA
jgi:hypothetical protein